jgi:hypothetical protein
LSIARVRRLIGREEIDQLTQEDPFYQGETAADQVIDFRTLKFSLSLVSLEKDDPEILWATE